MLHENRTLHSYYLYLEIYSAILHHPLLGGGGVLDLSLENDLPLLRLGGGGDRERELDSDLTLPLREAGAGGEREYDLCRPGGGGGEREGERARRRGGGERDGEVE